MTNKIEQLYKEQPNEEDGLFSEDEIKQLFKETSDDLEKTMSSTMPQVKLESYPIFSEYKKTYPSSSAKKKRNRYEEVEVFKTYTPDPFVREQEVLKALTPSDKEDIDNVQESLKIIKLAENTNVFVIVVDKNKENNVISAIRCSGGTAFGGYAHDVSRDSYLVECVECMQIGQLPFSFAVTMANVGDWQIKIPIPENVIEKYFNPQQRKVLEDCRNKYPGFDIHFIQMLGCN